LSTIKQTNYNWIENEQKPGKINIRFSCWLACNIAAGEKTAAALLRMSYKTLGSASALK
jgi:hypothetical protein